MAHPFEIATGAQPEDTPLVPTLVDFDALPPGIGFALAFTNNLPVLKAKFATHRLRNMRLGDSPYLTDDLPPFRCAFGIFSDDFDGGVAKGTFVMRQNRVSGNDTSDGTFTYSPYEEALRLRVREAEAERLWGYAEDISSAGAPRWRRVFKRLMRDGPDNS